MNRRRGRLAATVELAPLIDIVFLLLIFFMVSATFIRRNELQIDLPEARAELPAAGSPVAITVHRDGAYAVNGRPAAAGAALVQALALARGEREAPHAVIAADALAPHQAVVGALQAAGQSGLTRISILTRQPADGGERADAGIQAPDAMPPPARQDRP